MTFLRTTQRYVRFYRNRLFGPTYDARRKPRPDHDTDPERYTDSPPRRRRTRRSKRRTSAPLARLLLVLLYGTLAALLAARLTGRPLVPHIRAALRGLRGRAVSPAPSARRDGRRGLSEEALHPPQFGAHAPPQSLYGNPGWLRALEGAGADEHTHSYTPPKAHYDNVRVVPPPAPAAARRESAAVHIPRHALKSVPSGDIGTRTCHHSSHNAAALCVHVPFCVRHSSIVYLSDRLHCAPYSTRGGARDSLTMGHCVELEHDVETAAEIEAVEHRPMTWVKQLEHDKKVLWFEGDTVFLRMTNKCKSVTHFADRIFMLHHILQRPERYGMGAVSNVVIAADEAVAKKIRYTKSWHHGLLAAIVYPNKPVYSHKDIRNLVTSLPKHDGEIRVFVPSGSWSTAKGKLVPCFRRAVVSGVVRSQFFLSEDVFPGVVSADAHESTTQYQDADVFRTLLFRSLGHEGPPIVGRKVLYLHRAETRTFARDSLDKLEATLRTVASAKGFSYSLLNVAGLTFPEQIEAVAGAGVVVGIHGTQMLNTLFLPAGAAVVELFPYDYANELFKGGSGAGLHYARHQMLHGDDFPNLGKYRGVTKCRQSSTECRLWYQSDSRKLEFGMLDSAAVHKLVEDAIVHVQRSL